ncbi:DNA fragmentation factor subunit beta isoform X2 [Larus michahellis]|uniref:DNA fragmentation factor subunit beta isoform X2 n=1 Tax=Larus michahellis TaxID=119627 RepID=UPI003D9B6084
MAPARENGRTADTAARNGGGWRGPRGRLARAEGREREEMESRGSAEPGPTCLTAAPSPGLMATLRPPPRMRARLPRSAPPLRAHARPGGGSDGGGAAAVPAAWARRPAEVRCGGREPARAPAEGLPAAAGSLGRQPALPLRGRDGADRELLPRPAAADGAGAAGPRGELAGIDIEQFLAAFSSQRDAVVEAARKLLSDERAPRRQKLLADLIHNLSENILAEERGDDEKWFEGLESRFKNKSSYMRYSCESRIRSYMKEVSSFISNVHPTARDAYKGIIDLMSDKLKSVKYNGCYFDRREEEAARLCTTEGWFSCQGPFDRDDCPCKHSINPYSNRESRILFSTWNLDHIIEKKRAVVPELAEAVKTRDGREVNWEYFYQLLFTVHNLKLVHIACHKKTNHNLSCDKTKIYRKGKQNHKIS